MKRSPLKRKSKSEKKKLEEKLWSLCKEIIRKRHGNTCYTCGRGGLSGSNWHTGHMWPKAALSHHLKYDLRILRPQCYNCNIHLGGNGANFFQKMEKEFGVKYMNELTKERQIIIKADEQWFENKIKEYGEIYNSEIKRGL